MGAIPPNRDPDYTKAPANCLHCFAAGQTPKYVQAIITGMQWVDPHPPGMAYQLPNGVPCVMLAGHDIGGGPPPFNCIWSGFILAKGLPKRWWSYNLVMERNGVSAFSMWMDGVAGFFSGAGPFPPCKTTWTNTVGWPVFGGTAYCEWNKSVNQQRYDDQAADYVTTDRSSIILLDYNFGPRFHTRYEQDFQYNDQTSFGIRNRYNRTKVQILWDEQEYQDSL